MDKELYVGKLRNVSSVENSKFPRHYFTFFEYFCMINKYGLYQRKHEI